MSRISIPGYLRQRYIFRPLGPISPAEYAGSAWRGAFGHALRERSCQTGMDDCEHCSVRHECAYTYLFETPIARASLRGLNTNAPHPLIIRPLPNAQAHRCELELTLIGAAIDHQALVASAMAQAALGGVGRLMTRYQLQAVEYHDGRQWSDRMPASHPVPTLPRCPEQLMVHMITPLRLKQHEKDRRPSSLTPLLWLLAIRQRLAQLSLCHASEQGIASASLPYLREEDCPALRHALRWIELERYSSRQRRRHQMGGLFGQMAFSLHGLEDFWPALWHGQYLHAGRLTVMGMGAYRLETWQACHAGAGVRSGATLAASSYGEHRP